ncbi:MAG TPA: twin-arginine translocation signal domain-containing protein [Acidobacteriota bacterium]
MTDSDRRDFLKKAAAAAAALGIPATASAGREGAASEASPVAGAAPGSAGQQAVATPAAAPAETLRAVGGAVLPAGALGAGGIERVVAGFEAWIAGFAPVAEQPHGYLNRGLAEIRYGPPHPGPRWAAQIEALELEANRRHRARFAELSVEIRRALIQGQLERDELDRLPGPAQARHVALGLMAFFYDSSEATDLCYQASIGQFRCRGLSTLGREPRPRGG